MKTNASLICDVQFSDDSSYIVFEVNGEKYRIWYYKYSDKKVFQKIVNDGDDIIELGQLNYGKEC